MLRIELSVLNNQLSENVYQGVKQYEYVGPDLGLYCLLREFTIDDFYEHIFLISFGALHTP